MAQDTQQTRTVGHISLDKLAKVREWKVFTEKSVAADKANSEHEQAKEAMRVLLKKKLELLEETVIDFSKNGDRITITERLEPRAKRGRVSNSLDDRF